LKQILKDRWANYEGEVVRSDPTLEEQEDIIESEAPSSKSTSLT